MKVSTQVSEQATVETPSELMDDRDSRIQYELPLEGRSRIIWRNPKNLRIFQKETTQANITATSFLFNGVGIEIYGLKSSELGPGSC